MRLRTYLVEDCHITRDHIADALEDQAGAQVVSWASTESLACEWLAKNATAWDLIVVDLFLAQGSGLNVVKACAARRPGQRVVVFSNYISGGIRQRCLSLGADEVFDKATQLHELIRIASRELSSA